jgi:hypothetical protein
VLGWPSVFLSTDSRRLVGDGNGFFLQSFRLFVVLKFFHLALVGLPKAGDDALVVGVLGGGRTKVVGDATADAILLGGKRKRVRKGFGERTGR